MFWLDRPEFSLLPTVEGDDEPTPDMSYLDVLQQHTSSSDDSDRGSPLGDSPFWREDVAPQPDEETTQSKFSFW